MKIVLLLLIWISSACCSRKYYFKSFSGEKSETLIECTQKDTRMGQVILNYEEAKDVYRSIKPSSPKKVIYVETDVDFKATYEVIVTNPHSTEQTYRWSDEKGFSIYKASLWVSNVVKPGQNGEPSSL